MNAKGGNERVEREDKPNVIRNVEIGFERHLIS